MSDPLDVLYDAILASKCAVPSSRGGYPIGIAAETEYLRDLLHQHADLIADVLRAADYIQLTHLRYLQLNPLAPALDALKAALSK